MGVPIAQHEPLAQQELLAAPARRRLQVAVGHEAWWGVDTSTRGVSIAYVGPVLGVQTAPFDRALRDGALLAHAYREARELAARIVGMSALHRPGLIMVEQPSGRQPNPILSYTVGVVQAAIYEGVLNAAGRPPRIETCTSSWWKKRSVGSGAIRKPKTKTDPEYAVLTWARLNGYPGASWDEADALGIAEAARRDVALEAR